jgi:uncharacterized membrane protein YdbT with pleckstrin-like domain
METPKPLTEFTDEELLQEEKKRMESRKFFPFIIGLSVGIAAYSTFKNGIGFFTIFPLIFILPSIAADKKYKAVKAEIEARKLQ